MTTPIYSKAEAFTLIAEFQRNPDDNKLPKLALLFNQIVLPSPGKVVNLEFETFPLKLTPCQFKLLLTECQPRPTGDSGKLLVKNIARWGGLHSSKNLKLLIKKFAPLHLLGTRNREIANLDITYPCDSNLKKCVNQVLFSAIIPNFKTIFSLQIKKSNDSFPTLIASSLDEYECLKWLATYSLEGVSKYFLSFNLSLSQMKKLYESSKKWGIIPLATDLKKAISSQIKAEGFSEILPFIIVDEWLDSDFEKKVLDHLKKTMDTKPKDSLSSLQEIALSVLIIDRL